MKQYLLLTSALVAGGLLSGTARAACIQTPTCSSLGYESSTACEGGIKCPFGNAWNCTFINKITELEKIIEKIQIEDTLKNCKIGDILYSDKTCNANVVASKTPIGVVFDTTNRLAVAAEKKRTNMRWAAQGFAIPDLTAPSNIRTDLNGKNNTQLIINACTRYGYKCDAAEYAYNYKTEGTNTGDWYLPAGGELLLLLENYEKVNVGLQKIGAETIVPSIPKTGNDVYSVYNYIWSSSISSESDAYACLPSSCESENKTTSYKLYYDYMENYYVLPVLAF